MSDQQYLLVGRQEGGQTERRREWWWSPGPLDSCCCCCSLGFGIGFLAIIWSLSGFSDLVCLGTNNPSKSLENTIEELQLEWNTECSGLTVQTDECNVLMKVIESSNVTLEFTQSFLGQISVMIGALSLIYGIIGIVALCTRSPKWAKWFYYSSIASLVGTVVVGLFYMPYCYTADYVLGNLFSIFIGAIFGLYFAKVAWSFYKVTEAEEVDRQNSQIAVGIPVTTGTYQAETSKA